MFVWICSVVFFFFWHESFLVEVYEYVFLSVVC